MVSRLNAGDGMAENVKVTVDAGDLGKWSVTVDAEDIVHALRQALEALDSPEKVRNAKERETWTRY